MAKTNQIKSAFRRTTQLLNQETNNKTQTCAKNIENSKDIVKSSLQKLKVPLDFMFSTSTNTRKNVLPILTPSVNYYSTEIGQKFSKKPIQNARSTSTNVIVDKKLEYYRNKDYVENEKPADWDIAKSFEDIPGPKSYKFIGNSWRFIFGALARTPLAGLHEKFYLEYGDIMILKDVIGRSDMVFMYNTDEIEKLYRNEGVWPIRDQMKAFQYYRLHVRKDIFEGVGGLTTLQGEDWFKMRTVVNSILMQPRNAQIYLGSMNSVADQFLDLMRSYMRKNEVGEMPHDFVNDINKWSLESMGVIALDKHLGCLKTDLAENSHEQKMINGMQHVFDSLYKLEILPSFWKVFPTKDFKAFVDTMDFFTYTILDLIKEAKIRLSKQENQAPISAFERMIVQNEKVATAMCIDMIMAGIDTTSKTLSAALYFLAANPEAQKKLRAELMTFMPEKHSDVSKDILMKASYLKAVIKETTRLSPVAVGNVRTTQKDMVLSGYQIPKGTQVLLNHMYLCRREEHFKKPLEFLPERFLRSTTGEMSSKNTHPFVFQPFGFGPRSCIGKRLANLELEVALSKIIRNFELTWVHGEATFDSKFLYGIASPLKYRLKEVEQ